MAPLVAQAGLACSWEAVSLTCKAVYPSDTTLPTYLWCVTGFLRSRVTLKWRHPVCTLPRSDSRALETEFLRSLCRAHHRARSRLSSIQAARFSTYLAVAARTAGTTRMPPLMKPPPRRSVPSTADLFSAACLVVHSAARTPRLPVVASALRLLLHMATAATLLQRWKPIHIPIRGRVLSGPHFFPF